MRDELQPPQDDELERADALLDQADALLRRHRGSAPRTPPPATFPSAALEAETRLEPFALEDDDDLPILTDIVDGLELADITSIADVADLADLADRELATPAVPVLDDFAAAPRPAFAGDAMHFAAAAEDAASLEAQPLEDLVEGTPDKRSADEPPPPPSAQLGAAPLAGAAPSTIAATEPPRSAVPSAPLAPPMAPPLAPPFSPALSLSQPPALSPADEHALLVSARAALIEELVELDTEIARSVESWLEDELPQIVTRELDSLAERIRTEAIAQLRATLLPALSERIAHRIDKLVD
ncbi:hypothetical protein [Thauera sp. 2A1]|uniref:hypothetical protein n=1 Tax=Thauera sp. 2A1 TaxID=2570191 RepID=UPI001291B7D9|nr:hypothetical protein [Thauera sp. 2A1]KAI5912804.1 hypothetical protein GH664_20510 [Thauera sp. 2A1]